MIVLSFDDEGRKKFFSDSDLERLRNLLPDLERITAGVAPTEEDLANAPRLEDCYLSYRMLPQLEGHVYGHPLFPVSGQHIRTSRVWAIAPEMGWARTESRWYKLGSCLQSFNSRGAS